MTNADVPRYRSFLGRAEARDLLAGARRLAWPHDLGRDLGARRLLHRRRRALARHLLRALGLPDHGHPPARVASVRRRGRHRARHHRSRRVLGAPRASASPRAVRGPRCGVGLRGVRRALARARPAARRHALVAVLRRELAVRALRAVVLLRLHHAFAAAAPVVARGGGAVLPVLATDGRRRALARSATVARRRRGRRGRRRRDRRCGRFRAC